ncbi:MAG: anti-sigma factor [Rhizobiaceae bacterium]
MTTQDQQLDAAEYVIGTLTSEELRAFEDAVASDAELRRDVAFWENALGLMNASVAPEVVPDSVWPGIEQAIGVRSEFRPNEPATVATGASGAAGAMLREQIAANDNLIEDLRHSRRRWRFGAIAATLTAIAFGAILLNSGALEQPPEQQIAATGQSYIAVVNASGDQPSLVVNVDTATGDVTVRSLGIERPAGKSLEVWYVPEGQSPVSVGLVSEGEIDLSTVDVNDRGLLAISLEPEGGSPTGTATGPILYTGKLVENVNPKAK